MHPTGLPECVEKVAEAIEWGTERPSERTQQTSWQGDRVDVESACHASQCRDQALGWNWQKMVRSTWELGGQELGQGIFTVAAQMAAAALGVPYEVVRIATPVDTRYSPYEWQTVASRLTWSLGNAVVRAAKDARRQVLELVAEDWGEKIEDLDIVSGVVVSYKSEKETPLKNLVIYGLPKPGDQGWRGGPVIGRGNFMPTYVTGLDVETGQGERGRGALHYRSPGR